MSDQFEFSSHPCTTREESERLLSLGLKKETADMCIHRNVELAFPCPTDEGLIPAWSLHRIISMVYSSRAKKNGLGLAIIEYENPFEDMIRQIEWLIKEGYFNKEYLE